MGSIKKMNEKGFGFSKPFFLTHMVFPILPIIAISYIFVRVKDMGNNSAHRHG